MLFNNKRLDGEDGENGITFYKNFYSFNHQIALKLSQPRILVNDNVVGFKATQIILL